MTGPSRAYKLAKRRYEEVAAEGDGQPWNELGTFRQAVLVGIADVELSIKGQAR